MIDLLLMYLGLHIIRLFAAVTSLLVQLDLVVIHPVVWLLRYIVLRYLQRPSSRRLQVSNLPVHGLLLFV